MTIELTDAELAERYHLRPAAAYIKAELNQDVDLDECDEQGLCDLVRRGLEEEISLYTLKRTIGLARVDRVLGILHGIQATDLLDIGTGRGTFLWPLLDTFPLLSVTCIDQQASKVAHLQRIAEAGIVNLKPFEMSACELDFEDKSFDVVTALEVLEHIPEVERALGEIVRVARRKIIISVPSKADDNPEHLHLIGRDWLESMLQTSGIRSVNVDYVLNHMIAVVSK